MAELSPTVPPNSCPPRASECGFIWGKYISVGAVSSNKVSQTGLRGLNRDWCALNGPDRPTERRARPGLLSGLQALRVNFCFHTPGVGDAFPTSPRYAHTGVLCGTQAHLRARAGQAAESHSAPTQDYMMGG